MNSFPTDETTLVMLDAACQLDDESGQTHLQAFLSMGSRVESKTLVEGDEEEDGAIYFVEHEAGYEPFSETQVISALIAEIQRLRDQLAV